MPSKRSKTPNIRLLRKVLASLPQKVAIEAARKSADKITALALSTFDAGKTVYGDDRPLGVRGNKLTLTKSGLARRTLGFRWGFQGKSAVVKAHLSAKYVRFLIGKYRILPLGNHRIPISWQLAIDEVTKGAFTSACVPVKRSLVA